MIPDNPPILFRWQKRTHRVANASGPEGFIAKDYTETPLTQDGGYMAYLHETRANISGAEVQLG